MPRAAKVCTTAGCPRIVPLSGRCDEHQREYVNASARRRPSGRYNTAGHARFRRYVLAHDPVCVLCRKALSTVADHYPTSKRDLLATGQDANDPKHGRGLCKRCHDMETARHQPGGWHTGNAD